MSAHRCCKAAVLDTGCNVATSQSPGCNGRQQSLLRRCFGIAEWVVPGAILALLPKCPLCLAAYLALVTGAGISMSTLMRLRAGLIVLCAGSLFLLAIRSMRRFRRPRASHVPSR